MEALTWCEKNESIRLRVAQLIVSTHFNLIRGPSAQIIEHIEEISCVTLHHGDGAMLCAAHSSVATHGVSFHLGQDC